MEIEPVQVQLHFESSVRAFCSLMVTTDDPGDHGDVVTGMQGCGVRTPCAAAVAAATWGFAWVLHIPNAAMLTIGIKSLTVAPFLSSPVVPLVGSTVNEAGEVP